ncbi:MAG TPA: hypothetical protein VMJ75_27190 [Candidatus Acidoferrales bacterium]|nr:hypothetical protein [Candidatus Acidoferrales bacterium]
MGDVATIATTIRDGQMVWEVEGKPVAVRLSIDVISRLGMAVREGFKALPRRGLETGGLLIGTKKEEGNRVIVDVQDFEAVESEHAAGPSYLLSEADRQLLEARIAVRGTSSRKPSVVGFYRSHTRSGFGITMEDELLFSRYFRKSSDVFLLVKSNEGGPSTGGFVIREGGKILSDVPYAQFTFSPDIPLPPHEISAPPAAAAFPPAAAQAVRKPAPPAAAATLPPAAVQMVQKPKPELNATVIPKRVWLGGGGVVVVALVAAIWLGAWKQNAGSSHPTPPPPLALSVSSIGNGLRLSWDHQASVRASKAILWIEDGNAEQRVELDSHQLADGSIAYWPRSSDVNFRLQLMVPGGSASESVRSIGGPFQPATVAAPAAAASPVFPQILPSPEVVRVSRTEAPSRPRVRAFNWTEPVSAQPAAIPDPPPTPMVAPSLPAGDAFLHPVVPAETPSYPATGVASVRVRVEPVAHFSRRVPLVGRRHKHEDYVPPAPLGTLALPKPPTGGAARDVNIDVKVYVNSAGKVDYSEVLSKVTVADRDFAAAAIFSARKCDFVPAREGDEAVPGEVILHYQFGSSLPAAEDQAMAAR